MTNYGIINDKSPHIVADLCEIICYFEDLPVARGDIEEFINVKGGDGLLRQLAADGGAESNDRVQKFTEDAFKHLLYRQAAFGDWYPFKAEHDLLELKEPQTNKHKLYAALLADSRLKMFPGPQRFLLAAEFEALCREAAPGLFPNWSIFHFGVGGADRGLFGNRLKDALPRLAEKMRDSVIQKRVAELSDHDVGDGGIDLVAIREWIDPAESVPVYFAQCAAQQENWPEKRFESHPITHERYFNFFHKPGSVMFIPVCYRGPDGQWIDSDGHQSVLIDRLRILELFQTQIDSGAKTVQQILGVVTNPIPVGFFNLPAVQADAA